LHFRLKLHDVWHKCAHLPKQIGMRD
jgi:hypothetical protein